MLKLLPEVNDCGDKDEATVKGFGWTTPLMLISALSWILMPPLYN